MSFLITKSREFKMEQTKKHLKNNNEYTADELKALVRVGDWPDEAGIRKSIRSPLTAIRAMCRLCVGGASKEVAECVKTNCPLWAFRFGKNMMHGARGHTRSTQHLRGK